MTVKRIHHINFLVHDLDRALHQYAAILGQSESMALREELPGRGVRTARFKVADTWLILVQPTSEKSAPARHLEEHGEGFFLLSLEQDNIEAALRQGGEELVMDPAGPRRGLDNWTLWDIDPEISFGAQLQFCQEESAI